MSTRASDGCVQSELTCAYAARALSPAEAAAAERHIRSCAVCQREVDSLRPVLEAFVSWPTDILCPAASVQARLAARISGAAEHDVSPAPLYSEPDWEQVAPGIECKLLATDAERHRVSMLVRLAPGASYPAHSHAGEEELHLLQGELWIDGRKLMPGDYNYGAPGAGDEQVWSETGCTCFLMTSTRDILR
ncbi:MAG TPA: cupin domain-containing protein [Micropepsaceae bacterium]|nr:cupin domain-containing protein [Micropepsaceae bacterium]